ncbi:hypothetical protein DIE08_22390 [Burkholderia sp. Bp9004]|nr:hypothetical protein DIE08_22390 [Burkholderia sp. Bp9004]
MPRTASAGAAFLFSLHAHRRARRRRMRHRAVRPTASCRCDMLHHPPTPLPSARRTNAATWCGNSPRFLL